MRRSKDACKQPPISIPNLALAVEAVHKGLAVRAAAKQFSVSRTTLQRHLDDHNKSSNEQFFCIYKCAVWTIFSTDEEGKLIDYYNLG
jgi:hypothetical protein